MHSKKYFLVILLFSTLCSAKTSEPEKETEKDELEFLLEQSDNSNNNQKRSPKILLYPQFWSRFIMGSTKRGYKKLKEPYLVGSTAVHATLDSLLDTYHTDPTVLIGSKKYGITTKDIAKLTTGLGAIIYVAYNKAKKHGRANRDDHLFVNTRKYAYGEVLATVGTNVMYAGGKKVAKKCGLRTPGYLRKRPKLNKLVNMFAPALAKGAIRSVCEEFEYKWLDKVIDCDD